VDYFAHANLPSPLPVLMAGERDIVAYIKTVKRLLIEDIFKA